MSRGKGCHILIYAKETEFSEPIRNATGEAEETNLTVKTKVTKRSQCHLVEGGPMVL